MVKMLIALESCWNWIYQDDTNKVLTLKKFLKEKNTYLAKRRVLDKSVFNLNVTEVRPLEKRDN